MILLIFFFLMIWKEDLKNTAGMNCPYGQKLENPFMPLYGHVSADCQIQNFRRPNSDAPIGLR